MTHKLYLWNNWHNGDIITTIPLIWEIYNQIDNVEIVVGCYNNHAYLFEKTPIKTLMVHPNNDRDIHGTPFGFGSNVVDDLGYMCPEGYTNIYTWLGQYIDTHAHNWKNQVEVFNRKCEENNIPINLISNIVPGIKFPYVKLDVPMHSKMIWVENSKCRSGHSEFNYDMNKLGTLFPDLFFYTNADPQSNLSNVINCSHLNLIELSNLSNKCDVILGKGSGPYFATFTDTNRYKPRAVVGYNLRAHLPFWEYTDSSLQYINDENSLIDYLKNII
jgi:hypothetical protein